MKYLYFLAIFFFVGCKGCKSGFVKFQDEAVKLASDKSISKEDYESLIEIISTSSDKAFQQFYDENHKIDNNKVSTYLLKLFKAKSLSLTEGNIWMPEISANQNQKFNINVFLENSASIDGYVGVNSSFKTTIFKLLTDLKNFPSADSLNMNYINTKPILIKESATRDDIEDFYNRLNPSDFKSAGGTRASTDIEKMLKQLLDKSNTRNLSMFISDCVFSPGKKDAKKYLDGQYAAIYGDFIAAKNTNPTLSIIILQCTAMFEGTYFDYFDSAHANISAERPYYIWFIGTLEQIKSLVDYKIFDLIKNGYKNKLVIQAIKEVNQPTFKILPRASFGNFNRTDLAKGIITGASKSRDNKNEGLFGFDVAVDLSKSLQDSKYFLDTSNYELSDKSYSMKIEPINDKSDAVLSGFTHVFKLQTTDLKETLLRIDVVGKTPNWIYTTTSPNDTRIESDSLEMQKTFGFKHLVEGVCDAFYPKSKSNIVGSITINIKK